jgi:hypothetical protein
MDHQSALPRQTIDQEEQDLLNAIHSHPNKRDLVLNLLRQMNQSASTPPSSTHQQRHSEPSADYDPYRKHSNMDNNEEPS